MYLPRAKKVVVDNFPDGVFVEKLTGKPYTKKVVEDYKGDVFKATERESPKTSEKDAVVVTQTPLRETNLFRTGTGIEPTPLDYSRGSFTRYFIRDSRTEEVVEVTRDRYNIENAAIGRGRKYIKTLSIDWIITGNIDDRQINGYTSVGVRNLNASTMRDAEKELRGIKSLLKPAQYFKEKSEIKRESIDISNLGVIGDKPIKPKLTIKDIIKLKESEQAKKERIRILREELEEKFKSTGFSELFGDEKPKERERIGSEGRIEDAPTTDTRTTTDDRTTTEPATSIDSNSTKTESDNINFGRNPDTTTPESNTTTDPLIRPRSSPSTTTDSSTKTESDNINFGRNPDTTTPESNTTTDPLVRPRSSPSTTTDSSTKTESENINFGRNPDTTPDFGTNTNIDRNTGVEKVPKVKVATKISQESTFNTFNQNTKTKIEEDPTLSTELKNALIESLSEESTNPPTGIELGEISRESPKKNGVVSTRTVSFGRG
jgi:hypothetical protein